MAATTVPFRMTGGRLAALVIGVPVCLGLVAGTAFSTVTSFAEGKYPVSYTAPAGTRALTLNVTGQLTIEPTTSSRATLAGTAHYGVVRPTLAEHSSAGATTLGYGCDFPEGNCGLDATVTVPATVTTLTAHSGGGNDTVNGTTGALALSTGDGDLSVGHASGPVALNTDSGSIRVSAVTSPAVTASTGDGDVEATGVTSPTIAANSNSGNITGSGIAAATVNASSGNGDIVITFSAVPQDVHVNTDSGSITLVLPKGPTEYNVTANTDSGTVSDAGISKNSSSSHVITASSGDGNISISQQ